MLNIEGGDVIGQEHNLITEEIIGIFLFEDATIEATDDVNNEVTSSGGRIEDLDTRSFDGFAKFLLENNIDTFYHKIDDFLRIEFGPVARGLSLLSRIIILVEPRTASSAFAMIPGCARPGYDIRDEADAADECEKCVKAG